MNAYQEEAGKVLQNLNASREGLSSQEARKRAEQCGKNKLREPEKPSLIRRFFSQLSDSMTIILLAAAAVSGVTSAYSGEGFADVVIILIVVCINAVRGVY